MGSHRCTGRSVRAAQARSPPCCPPAPIRGRRPRRPGQPRSTSLSRPPRRAEPLTPATFSSVSSACSSPLARRCPTWTATVPPSSTGSAAGCCARRWRPARPMWTVEVPVGRRVHCGHTMTDTPAARNWSNSMAEATPPLEPVQFNPAVPNVARMYDYYLGGKNNFAADRKAAEQALSFAPELRVGAQEVRKFLRRAVRFLTDAGIRQFVDIGCGLPTQGNVHEIAQAAAPDSRVAYIDNDPIVISHAQALLGGNPGTVVVQADIRAPARLIAHPTLRGMIDLDEPVGVLLIAVLHVIPEDDLATRIVEELRETIAPGSYIV